MKARYTKFILALTSLIFVASGCTATTNNIGNQRYDTSATVLKLADNKRCGRGFIAPPGTKRCLNIDDIVAGNISIKAPAGRCPKNWSKLTEKGFCLPENRIVSCSRNEFRCGTKRSDTIRIEKGLPKCELDGKLIAVDFQQFNPSGTFTLDATICLTCGPVERIPEV